MEPETAPAIAISAHSPAAESTGSDLVFQQRFPLDSGDELTVSVARDGVLYRIFMFTDAAGPIVLHWGGMKRARSSWQLPDESIRPAGTSVFDDVSVDTPFQETGGLRELQWEMAEDAAPRFIGLVLHQTETGRWLKHRGRNIDVRIVPPSETETPLDAIAERIVEGETGKHGWTLMHRFNLCHDLIDDAGGSREAWALLFVWLRYSAVRQLDWQRNYNTKPRELAHAQDRLTARLASAYCELPANRDLIRLMLGCLGRGGDGQRIRDEILHIMHRHHIKEVGGTWMEQWHQKLHNNTTPDDIVICEAFLAFLRSDGDLGRYREALLAGGVTEKRLASFERPINRDPEWHPHLKDGLIHDFVNYLVLLKSVHSGTDLMTAVSSGGHLFDGDARGVLHRVLKNFNDPGVPVVESVRAIADVRGRVGGRLAGEGDPGVVKELLYLDLALEQALRTVMERGSQSDLGSEELLELMRLVLATLLIEETGDAELAQCRRELDRLPEMGRSKTDWALHAKAATDRLRTAVEARIDGTYQLLQPKAERLGKSFEADEWVVNLFSEEIVRGQTVFLLSLLIHHFDPILRRMAKLGDWQVVSPSTAVGEVMLVDSFRTLQGKSFDRPMVVVAEKVHGDEEPPEGVCAVITPSSVDLVSHVAVRTRNAELLFATCYDPRILDELRKSEGRVVRLAVNPSGDVLIEEAGDDDRPAAKAPAKAASARKRAAKPSLDVLAMTEFTNDRVGGKSWHLRELADKLPDWIHTPRSIALPFGVFDAVLADSANQSTAARYRDLLGNVAEAPEVTLAAIRGVVLELEIPAALRGSLDAAMRVAGLPVPDDWERAAMRIKQVWASKWNDRAYFSREARGFPHDSVQMAVLIQEVVPAEFAYVIHTVNPFNGDPAEIYAEVVLGLGETLVGNYPGRAMSFVASKDGGKPKVLAYPAKGAGLFGGGLIFRSDSNAEDLEGYAGAGLYDSVLLDDPDEVTLDYTGQPLVWDAAHRTRMLTKITQIGEVVEQAFGTAQDIEGAFANGTFTVVQTRPQVGL